MQNEALQDFFATIRTMTVEFLQEIFSELIAIQLTLPVLNSTDLGILHELHIELHKLQADGCDGTPAPYPSHPGENIGDSAFQ